jgi:hypothetical protein
MDIILHIIPHIQRGLIMKAIAVLRIFIHVGL